MAGCANRLFIVAAVLFSGALLMYAPEAYAQGDEATSATGKSKVALETACADDAMNKDPSVAMLCKMHDMDEQVTIGFGGIMMIFKLITLAVTVGVVVVIAFKRMTNKDSEDPMVGAKNVLYIMIIATAIIWIGTEFIVGDTTTTGTTGDTDEVETPVIGGNGGVSSCAGTPYPVEINDKCYRHIGAGCVGNENSYQVTTDAGITLYCALP